jgi:hypothetical protein
MSSLELLDDLLYNPEREEAEEYYEALREKQDEENRIYNSGEDGV